MKIFIPTMGELSHRYLLMLTMSLMTTQKKTALKEQIFDLWGDEKWSR